MKPEQPRWKPPVDGPMPVLKFLEAWQDPRCAVAFCLVADEHGHGGAWMWSGPAGTSHMRELYVPPLIKALKRNIRQLEKMQAGFL